MMVELSRVISNFVVQNFPVVDSRTEVGSYVQLYGPVGPSYGLFTVQLDGGPPRTLNASRSKFTPRMVLYQESGLNPENHTLRVTNSPSSGRTLSSDYAIVGQSRCVSLLRVHSSLSKHGSSQITAPVLFCGRIHLCPHAQLGE